MTTESNSHFKALCIGHFAMGTITSTLTVRICISPENKTKKKKRNKISDMHFHCSNGVKVLLLAQQLLKQIKNVKKLMFHV